MPEQTPDANVLPAPRLLDLGCGRNKKPGYFGVDKLDMPQNDPTVGGVDLIHDLEVRPWPIADGCAEEVLAHQVIEHLRDLIGFMDELWRVCAPGAFVEFTSPYCANVSEVYGCPTHVRGYSERTFEYFEPGYVERFSDYGIQHHWHVVDQAFNPKGNLWVLLRPIKTDAMLAAHRKEKRWRDRKAEMLG